MKTGKEFINDLGWDLTRTMYIDDAVEIVERAMEAGRQEIRDRLLSLRDSLNPKFSASFIHALTDVLSYIAPKPQRYVVAPAGAELGADEQRVRKQDIDSAALHDKQLSGPVYLKPGWTSDKECRDIVAKLLRDGVEVREV